MDARLVDDTIEAIRAGRPVVLPTDTVYGLFASPEREPVLELYSLKGRENDQPTALVAVSVDALLDFMPELGDFEQRARALLPGALTLVLPNPERRLPWLTGSRPDTIGVRVPELTREARAVVQRVGPLAATSANLPGGPDPRRLDDIPEEIRAGSAHLIDGGELPGTPSTVLDLTGEEPVVLREGAVPAADAVSAARG